MLGLLNFLLLGPNREFAFYFVKLCKSLITSSKRNPDSAQATKISKAQTTPPPFEQFFPKANLKLTFLWKTRVNEKILKSHAMCEAVVAIAVAISCIQMVAQVFAELRAKLCGKMQNTTSFQNQFRSPINELLIIQRIC